MITAAIASFCMLLGVGFGMLLHSRKPEEKPRAPSSVDMLLEQARWLPVARITHRKRDDLGYPSLTGVLVATLELEGDIRLIAGDKAINNAYLEYNGTRIGLDPDRRAMLGAIFKNRVAELAMASAETKLLGP